MVKTFLALGFVVLSFCVTAFAEDETVPSIKKIMKDAHNAKVGVLPAIRKDLSAPSPDWDKISKESKELVTLAEALAKNAPRKGSKSNWSKVTSTYLSEAKDLAAAAQSKDLEKAKTAQTALQGSCTTCHKAHK